MIITKECSKFKYNALVCPFIHLANLNLSLRRSHFETSCTEQWFTEMSSKSVDVQSHLNGIIEKILSNGVNKSEVQGKYILPPNERPQLSEVSYSESIPVVDLKDLDGPNRAGVVQEIRHACEEDGFFQVRDILPSHLINNYRLSKQKICFLVYPPG
jgi:hypothetical protein